MKAAITIFQIKPTLGIPIYRQIMDQVKRMIASGYLKPNDELPSIRQVASFFEVNQMTVSKAYSLLEAQGILEHNRGKRMMISDTQRKEHTTEKRLQLLRPVLLEIISQARQLALPNKIIISEIKKILEEENE